MCSRTIKKLRKIIIKDLPFFPNDRSTLAELESQSLNNLLIQYLHWKTRIIPPRPRAVTIDPEVTKDKRWKSVNVGTKAILKKISNGEDIKPHLSKRIQSYGYTPTERIRNGLAESWEDKDQLLNVMGFHHIHLNPVIQSTGLGERTDVVLFAHVTRSEFKAIGLFDHSVFDTSTNMTSLNLERERLWSVYEKHIFSNNPGGGHFLVGNITTSGHPISVVHAGDFYEEIITRNDSMLGDYEFAKKLYGEAKLTIPSKFKFEWDINHLDLCIYDSKNNTRFIFYKGPI